MLNVDFVKHFLRFVFINKGKILVLLFVQEQLACKLSHLNSAQKFTLV